MEEKPHVLLAKKDHEEECDCLVTGLANLPGDNALSSAERGYVERCVKRKSAFPGGPSYWQVYAKVDCPKCNGIGLLKKPLLLANGDTIKVSYEAVVAE